MKANNQVMANPNGGKKKLSEIYLADGAVQMFKRAIGNENDARRVLTTVLTAVQRNPKLQECDSNSVLTSALDGEVTKNLSLSNGEFAIVPYGKKATMQVMVNGIKKMCIRSKAYKDIDCFEVRDGEFKGFDPRTRRPIIEWNANLEEREQLPIIGYYAFYELGDDYNNFSRCIYWTHDQILRHADRYSKAFKLDTWKQLMAGEIKGWDADKLRAGSPWYGDPYDLGHQKMCMKTVLKQLLSDGFAPKEISVTINADNAMERSGEPVIQEDFIDLSFAEAPEAPSEAREAAESGEQGDGSVVTPPKAKATKPAKKQGVPAVPAAPVIDVEADELLPVPDDADDPFAESFFN